MGLRYKFFSFFISFIVFFLFWATPTYATTYYVDNTGGNNSNNGTSTSTAWQTLSKVNGVTFSPGDNILFKRGETWRGELNPTASGTSGNPITYSDYGSGNKPIINGSQLMSGWTLDSGNVWQVALTTSPTQVFFNSTRGTNESSKAALNAANEWYWSSNVLYVYSTSNPTSAYTNPGIEATIYNSFQAFNKNYITFKNIDVTKGKYGVWFHGNTGSSNPTVTNVEASWHSNDGIAIMDANSTNGVVTDSIGHDNLRHGVFFYNGANNGTVSGGTYYNNTTTDLGSGVSFTDVTNGLADNVVAYGNFYGMKVFGTSASNITFQNSTSRDNIMFGIDIDTTGDGMIVQNNNSYGNDSHGIAVEVDTPGTIVRYNTTHDNGTADGVSGIEVETGINTQVYYNVVYNERDGISLYGAINPKVYNNTIYNTADACINVYVAYNNQYTSGLVLKNNSISNCNFYYINVPTGHQTGFVSDYNDWYGSGTKMRWGSTNYTLAGWQAVNSQDSHSFDRDPQYISLSSYNFSLLGSSPLINTGVNVGLTQAFGGTSVPQGSAPDIGAYEYTTPGSTNTPSPSNPGPPTCTDSAPTGTPNLFQIDATSTQATLYFAPVSGSVSSYYISYGLSSGNYQYGTNLPSNPTGGALSYTINSLAPNTTYYFTIRSGNGCATGQWSNEMSAKTAKKGAKSGISYFKNFPSRVMSLLPKQVSVLGGSTSSKTTKSSKPQTGGSCEYTVQPGDTLWNIASSELGSGSLFTTIKKTNQAKYPSLESSNALTPGWKLKIGC